MHEFFHSFVKLNLFIPHGHCYLWKPELVGLHLISDVTIALAYYSIPITLLYFVRLRRDLPFYGIFLLFSAFIISCGTTHLMEVWTLWHPIYWVSGAIKAIAALVSLYTSFILASLIPEALALPSLAATNQKLEAEIAERQKTEIALRQSEEKFRRIFEQAAVGMCLVSVNGQFIRINPKLSEILGYSQPELLNLKFRDVTHPEDLAFDLEQVQKLLTGEIQTCLREKRYIRKDGAIVQANLTVSLLRDAAGNPQQFISVIQDITDRKRAEAALQESESRFQAFMNNSPTASWITDENGRLVYISETYKQVFQIPEDYIPQKTDRQLYSPELAQQYLQNIRKVVQTRQAVEAIELAPRRDGTIGQFLVYKFPLQSLSKQLLVGGVAIDITDRVRAEQALQQLNQELEARVEQRTAALQASEQRFRNLVETSSDWVWEVNEHNVYTYVSPKIFDILGYQPDEIIGKTPFELMPSSEAELVAAEFRKLKDARQPFHCLENTNLHRCGNSVVLETSGVPFFDRQGNFQGYRGIDRDITRRKQVEAELLAITNLQQAILDGTDYAIISNNIEGVIQTFNSAAQKMLGYTAEEVVGQITPAIFHDPEQLKQRAEALSLELGKKIAPGREFFATKAQNGTYEDEWTYIRKDGSRFPVLLSIKFLEDSQGKTIGFLGIAKDITQQKQIEAQLRQNAVHLATAQRIAHLGSWETDLQTQEIVWSEEVFRIFGRDPASGPPSYTEFRQSVHPDDLDRHDVSIQQTIEQGQLYEYEYRLLHPDGKLRYLLARAEAILDTNGKPVRVVGTVLDLTDRKLAEQQLQESRMMLQLVLDTIPQRVFWKDRQFRYLGCNRTFAEDGQISIEEILGKTDFELPWAKWAHLYRADDTKVIKTGIPKLGYEEPTEFTNGKSLWIRTNKVPLTNSVGEIIGVLGSYEDITDRKLAEEKLRHTNEELMLANVELARATRLKDEFLANMSHELRTPLNVILGMAEGLQDSVFGEMDERQKKSLATIESSGRHLLELINDILDLSKIEAGKLELEISDVTIKELCEASVVFVKHLAFKKGIHFHTNIPENLGSIEADERRLRQALINLLSNAIKFTAEGGSVTLEVRLENAIETPELQEIITSSIPKSSYHLCFAVIDTGIGIAPENLGKLFQAFVQIDSSLSRRYSGTGLGLALVKQIANLHGGTVSVSSEVGRGSCFTIRIPYLGSSQSDRMEVDRKLYGAIASSVSTLESPLILLVEDNQPTSDTVSSYLKSCGYRLIVADNGQQALNLAQSQQPNLILMDIQMPEMDGLEAIRQIRAQGQTDIPIIALTALAMSGDRQKCLQAGADEYLTKPIPLQRLSLIIQQILSENNKNL
ncbi:PAS domain S-box protein [Aerosakkonema sp. BLCC-F183]|uniref:PAS domain S-box protein n=1 Tax=Aerosakkonema sp. BLCC-F183 TaxID=3342834 RepID=UPI0035B836E6